MFVNTFSAVLVYSLHKNFERQVLRNLHTKLASFSLGSHTGTKPHKFFCRVAMYKVFHCPYARDCCVSLCCSRGACFVLFAVAEIDSAAAIQQSKNENQAAGINRQAEISHFATAAAQIQDDKQNPSAVATAQASAFFAAATAAFAVIEHSVEHNFTSISPTHSA